jgi:hypothetical protein
VAELLESFRINRDEHTVLNLWSLYGKYARRFPKREAMPRYHLKGILGFILPTVKAWAEKAGISVLAPQVSEPDNL